MALRWHIVEGPSEVAPLGGHRCWAFVIELAGARRSIFVKLDYGLVADRANLEGELLAAVETNGASVVEMYLSDDEPPRSCS